MSGKFVITKDRKRYRYDLLDASGEVVFKGSIASSKDDILRKIKMIQGFGPKFTDHLQAVEGRIANTYVIRGEEHSAREGEQGRVGDAIPLGFGTLVGTKDEVLATKDAILEAAENAEVVDETGE